MSKPRIDLETLRKLDRRGDATLLYHATSADAAREILVDGLRDSFGTFGMEIELRGVWLSNRPLDVNEGAKDSDVVLEVDVDLTDDELRACEIQEERNPYREFCIPEEKLRGRSWIRVIEGENEVVDGPNPRVSARRATRSHIVAPASLSSRPRRSSQPPHTPITSVAGDCGRQLRVQGRSRLG